MSASLLLQSQSGKQHCQQVTVTVTRTIDIQPPRDNPKKNESAELVVNQLPAHPPPLSPLDQLTMQQDTFRCHVYDENIANAKYFRAVVQVGSEAVRIVHKDRDEEEEVEPFPYLLNLPGVGFVHDVSFRGVELLQRHKNEFTFRGVRAPVTIHLHSTGDIERMRRLLSNLHKVRSDWPSSPMMSHSLPVFQHVSERQLAEVLDQCSLKLFRWSNMPLGSSRPQRIAEFWINRHFVQDALGPTGMAAKAGSNSFEEWQNDQRIVLKALEKISRIVRLQLKEYIASNLNQVRSNQQLMMISSANEWQNVPVVFLESHSSIVERIGKRKMEEVEALLQSNEYPDELDPFAEGLSKTDGLKRKGKSEGALRKNASPKQVFYLVRTRLLKLFHKWNVFKKNI